MAKAKKTVKTTRMSRKDAANKTVVGFQGRTTLGELAAAADGLVVESGGKSNLKASAWYTRRCLESAAAFGLVTLTKPTDIVVEKAGS